MKTEKLMMNKIPVIVWGDKSDKVYIFVHGKMSNKESAEYFAKIADKKGYQTISFDLPEHGERLDKSYRCDVWNGIDDLKCIGEYGFNNWSGVSLFACSLGAFFSLHAYNDRQFKNVLFQSPIVDMEYLIQQMFCWFGVSEEMLEEKKEIETSIDILSWKYFCYVKEHPIQKWTCPTHILYGAKDTMQSQEIMNLFCDKFQCEITVSENSEHSFSGPKDCEIITQWFQDNI